MLTNPHKIPMPSEGEGIMGVKLLSGGFRRISHCPLPLSPPPLCHAIKNKASHIQNALQFRKSFPEHYLGGWAVQ